jgi:hypothetical protein
MLFKGIIAVYTENHTEHKYKTQSYWVWKHVVHIVTTEI